MVLGIRKIIFIGHSFLPRFATDALTKNGNFFECQNLASKRQPIKRPWLLERPELDRFVWDKDCGGIVN